MSFPLRPWLCWKCSQTFLCAWHQGYGKGDWSSNKKVPRKYFALPNCGSNQNQKTSTYRIGNQTQYHRTLTSRHTILHQKYTGVQHPFQLSQQKKSFMFFLYPWSISKKRRCCDVTVTQINYPSLNKQDSIEQARGRFHEKGSSQDFYAIWYEI